jgi:putative membrane protein
MKTLLHLIISGIAVVIAAYLLPGVELQNFIAAIVVAVVIGVLNALLRPVLIILTLPINILTLGLFTFVINALIVLVTSAVVPGFAVDNFWWALLFSLVLAIVNWFLAMLEPTKNKPFQA